MKPFLSTFLFQLQPHRVIYRDLGDVSGIHDGAHQRIHDLGAAHGAYASGSLQVGKQFAAFLDHPPRFIHDRVGQCDSMKNASTARFRISTARELRFLISATVGGLTSSAMLIACRAIFSAWPPTRSSILTASSRLKEPWTSTPSLLARRRSSRIMACCFWSSNTAGQRPDLAPGCPWPERHRPRRRIPWRPCASSARVDHYERKKSPRRDFS